MKKLSKIISLALVLSMLLGVSVLAAEVKDTEIASNDKAAIWSIKGAGGATVKFDASNKELIHVTYEATGLVDWYLIMMVTAEEGKDQTGKGNGEFTMSDPGTNTIKYIDQVPVGDADSDGIPDIEFEVYPESITDSIIMIYGLMPDGSKSLKAAIVDAKYVLGDVDRDGAITAFDAVAALRAAAGLDQLESDQLAAAEVDGEAGLSAFDAVKILRVAAELESF